ncbi:MAG: hypothetical protein MJ185_02835 [Treponema sp.]|nr:hypothetical protein [Treponema sp.]
MKEIPVIINVGLEDVIMISELLEEEEETSTELRSFATKYLESVKKSSEELSEIISAINGVNPLCMEKIEM